MVRESLLSIRTTEPFGGQALMVLTTLAMLVGAVVAIAHPPRGLPDRLAGTWIVPR